LLGVTEHHWLDYPDGGCASIPADQAVARVEALMNDIRPATVLTFGPDGQTGHPDHIAISQWTTEAFKRAAPADASLFYATVTPEWAKRFLPLLEPYNVFGPETPEITESSDVAIHVRVEGELLDTKLRSLAAQVSQTEGLIAAFGRDAYLEAISEETFRRA
jgi:LmbE family N-acetylglucosaminyl deacetylase